MRIQPIDSTVRNDAVKPVVLKSRLKRLFDRPFNGVLRASSADKPAIETVAAEFEPSTVCLDNMVQNFLEENEKQFSYASAGPAGKISRNRCNCFNGNSNDSSDDELDFPSDGVTAKSSFSDLTVALLKSLVPCTTVEEKNLLADTSKIVEQNKSFKTKDKLRQIVTAGLIALDYDASFCKSKWEKTSSSPAGEYEYIDVIVEGERMLIDVDFRSEFEIARSTSNYKAILQCLPVIFVGKSDRLLQIVSLSSEATRQSLKKKGMHIAPWRKTAYVEAKWFSSYTRFSPPKSSNLEPVNEEVGELDLIFGEEREPTPPAVWQLPAVKPNWSEKKNKVVVTGLAYLLREKY